MTRNRQNLPESHNLKGEYAGFVSRMIAYVTDRAIIIATISIVTTFVLFVMRLFGITPELLFDGQYETLTKISTIALVVGWFLLNVVFYYSYFIFCWMLIGQTPGKMLMGVRVVSTDGTPVSFKQAILRIIGYWISAIALGLGFLWILVSDTRQGWHDRMAKTFVIYTWDAEAHYILFRKLAKLADKRAAAFEEKQQKELAAQAGNQSEPPQSPDA